MLGRDHAALVAAGNEHQRAVVLVHVVQKNRHIHGPLSGHHVVVQPGAVVLVPLPDVALKRHLAVDLELVHVELLAQQRFHRLDHARVPRQRAELFAHHVRGKVGAHRVTAFFAHVEGIAPLVERGHCVEQVLGFLRRKKAGEEKITVAVKLFELFGCEFHGGSASVVGVQPCTPDLAPQTGLLTAKQAGRWYGAACMKCTKSPQPSGLCPARVWPHNASPAPRVATLLFSLPPQPRSHPCNQSNPPFSCAPARWPC